MVRKFQLGQGVFCAPVSTKWIGFASKENETSLALNATRPVILHQFAPICPFCCEGSIKFSPFVEVLNNQVWKLSMGICFKLHSQLHKGSVLELTKFKQVQELPIQSYQWVMEETWKFWLFFIIVASKNNFWKLGTRNIGAAAVNVCAD